MSTAKNANAKVAVAFVNNEIVLESLKKILKKMGYSVRQDMESCLDARFAVIGAYFAYLGIVKHVRAMNPDLPIVVIETGGYKLNGTLSEIGHVYDVIRIHNHDEAEINRKIKDWFVKGHGRLLTENTAKRNFKAKEVKVQIQ